LCASLLIFSTHFALSAGSGAGGSGANMQTRNVLQRFVGKKRFVVARRPNKV